MCNNTTESTPPEKPTKIIITPFRNKPMLLYQKVFEIFVGFSVLPIFYYEFNLLYRIDEYNASTIKPAPIKPVIISDTSINVPTYINVASAPIA